MLHFASQEKTSLVCKNSVSTKNPAPAQSFINNSKIPKHIIPSVQTSVDTHTFSVTGNDIFYKKYIEIIYDETIGIISGPSLTQPSNKAPPAV
ncbi:MAG: hypothetical protein M0Q21_10960 [Ignavibacteriaceae bacterium]|jgi:hypothetical protein|nr:hypothetical protein [Ignavibacteriaceae bacterium]